MNNFIDIMNNYILTKEESESMKRCFLATKWRDHWRGQLF